MSLPLPKALHPWPPLISEVMKLDSTETVSLIDKTGLSVNWSISIKDSYSNKTRNRAYRPRIDDSYYALDSDTQLRAAWILATELTRSHPEIIEAVSSKLSQVGWKINGNKLTPTTSTIRELFLTQSTEFDSYLAIKRILNSATFSIDIIDPYINDTIFKMIASLKNTNIRVNILTNRASPDINLAQSKIEKQYHRLSIELRKTSSFHDRFIITDSIKYWHIGASIKDAGNKVFMINEIEDNENKKALQVVYENSWKSASPIT